MNRPHPIQVHYFIRSLILLGFALYIGHLSSSGSLHYYIAPDMARWINYSTIPLTVMSLSLAYQALFHKENKLCGCEQPLPQSIYKNITIYGLFLLPLLLGTLLPDQALGSMTAAKKGMSLSSPALSSDQLSTRFKAPDKYNTEFADIAKIIYQQQVIEVKPEVYSEIIGAIELFKDQFVGKKIKISGFVYEDRSLNQNREFILGRFLVQCCTADANPFGVLVIADQPIESLQKDSWVEVQGVLRTELRDGKEIIAIAAEQINKISRPDSPYVYPNGDPITDLHNNKKSGTD